MECVDIVCESYEHVTISNTGQYLAEWYPGRDNVLPGILLPLVLIVMLAFFCFFV
ncbi:hypothetical protein BDV41DRAFT_537047 [Aspergillus transmontanensis]|uniref:Uncharacterized protein n=1 Tax=Aspergillus transmontanensis TaxID=1034304 RepID=A0A5N6W1W7_9EURO|nr:hypothetical protein BDV41DRAFT_537047 [Aspergillus transmontanensis]